MGRALCCFVWYVFVLGKAITWENWFPGQKSSYLGTVQSLQFPLNLGKKDQLINKGWKAAKWEGCVKRAVIWIWCVKGCVLFLLKRKPKSFFLLLCGQPIHFLSDSAVKSPVSGGTMCGFGRPRLETVTSLLGDVRGSLWSWYWVLFVRLLLVHKQQRITDSRASV